jgi:hypothetical protein
MMNEKTYLKLIRRLPVVKCPDKVISQVLQTCDTPPKPKKKYSMPLLRETAYGTGCVIIIAIILIMCKYSNDNQLEYRTRFAVNSHLLVRQLTNGASILFAEKIK